MRKIRVLLIVLTALLLVSVFSGCEDRRSDSGGQTLTLNKKYYYSSDIPEAEAQWDYIIFTDGEKGQYRYYYKDANFTTTSIYTINFKYLLIDDTVVCFYDSVTYDPEHNQSKNHTTWKNAYGFSKDILMNTSGVIYICEDYLPNIPNFGK